MGSWGAGGGAEQAHALKEQNDLIKSASRVSYIDNKPKSIDEKSYKVTSDNKLSVNTQDYDRKISGRDSTYLIHDQDYDRKISGKSENEKTNEKTFAKYSLEENVQSLKAIKTIQEIELI